jgi:hypothetical protein
MPPSFEMQQEMLVNVIDSVLQLIDEDDFLDFSLDNTPKAGSTPRTQKPKKKQLEQ